MADRWDDVDELVVATATDDLEATGEVVPCFVAFAGDHLRFIAFLRPFAKGAYADPIVELSALAMPLDADRLALSVGARVWSLDDPVPPVTADADLRQRVLQVEYVDGTAGRPRHHSVLHAFDLADSHLTWHDPVRLDDGEGWIPEALTLAVQHRRRLATTDAEIARQAQRCVALGHDLYLAPAVSERLGMAELASPD